MHTVNEAVSLITKIVRPIAPHPADAIDHARGASLAQDIRMDQDSPPFDRSQLDGYAVVAANALAGAELEVVGRVDAGGNLFTANVERGQCVAINTGGVVPPWTDAVVMVEHTKPFSRDGKNWVSLSRAAASGYGIQRKGADVRAGDVVLRQGASLHSAGLAVCAAAGVWNPLIRQVKVGVLSTGDELIEGPDDPAGPGRIRNSNGPMLRALIAEAGGVPINLGVCRDEVPLLEPMLTKALRDHDLLVVCGGMSMGTRDHVPPLLKKLGVTLHIEKIRMKPGKPFIFGAYNHEGTATYVAGLPGNPVSSFVTFQRFVRDIIARLGGASGGGLRALRARTTRPVEENGDREFFQPCRLVYGEDAALSVETLKWKGSADLFTLAKADGLLVRPADAPALEAGAVVDVLAW